MYADKMEKREKRCVLALGYFDGVHIGHRAVVAAAKELAEESGAECGVFTFAGDLGGRFGKEHGMVYTTEERKELLLEDCGADFVYAAPCDEAFFALTKEAFLDWLEQRFPVEGYACGFDYTFGKGGAGNADFLRQYAAKRGRSFRAVEALTVGGEKVSSTEVKRLLREGEIEKANALLTRPYFVTGKVIRERGVGRAIGFPTVNLYPSDEKLRLKNGVYGGHAEADGKEYKAIVNYGSRPTFGLYAPLVEAHLIGYDGNLYGRTMRISFDTFLRDIRKFKGEEELKEQLQKDREEVLRR